MSNLPTDPPTLEAFNQLWKTGYQVTGEGIETTASMPCPFCAWPGFMTYKILEVRQVMSETHKCAHCGRSSRCEVSGSLAEGGISFVMLLVAGPDVADYLPPARRDPLNLSKQDIDVNGARPE